MELWIELAIGVLAFGAAGLGVWTAYVSKQKGKDDFVKQDNDQEITNPQGGTNVIAGQGSHIVIGEHTQPTAAINQDAVDSSTEIKLAPVYTSLFAEENRLKTEQIHITSQNHGKISGTVYLNETNESGKIVNAYTYSLTGQFSNKVLTAEYTSQEERIDERGAINLKLIDSDLLSGFCSFSKTHAPSDDEIRVSPYVWVAGKDKDLLDGTYEFCTECYKEKVVCCCASEEIDMPIFLDSEEDAIRCRLSKKKRDKKQYSKALAAPYDTAHARQIIRDTKLGEGGSIAYSKCHFFDYSEKKCKIYEGRPIDCRLFPFDIKLSGDKTEYIIGYYPDLCDRDLPHTAMKRYAHMLRPYFFLLYPYLHIITSEPACERLNKATFKKLANFKDFVF